MMKKLLVQIDFILILIQFEASTQMELAREIMGMIILLVVINFIQVKLRLKQLNLYQEI